MQEAAGCFVMAIAARGKLGKSAWLTEKLILMQAASDCGEDEVDPLMLVGYGVSFGHNTLG